MYWEIWVLRIARVLGILKIRIFPIKRAYRKDQKFSVVYVYTIF